LLPGRLGVHPFVAVRLIGASFALLCFACASASEAQQTQAAGPSTVYTTIVEPALALVEAGNGAQRGTAFCIYSTGTTAYFLTNQHVIADKAGKPLAFALYFPDQPDKPVVGRVVKAGSLSTPSSVSQTSALLPDLAVIAVDLPHKVTTLAINTGKPAQLFNIDIAGYPETQIQNWLQTQKRDLQATAAGGQISGFDLFDYYIQYNGAITDVGNSGGPLYDPASGSIYGIITDVVGGAYASVQHGMAISAATIRQFLTGVPNLTVAVYTPPPAELARYGASKELTGSQTCVSALERLSKHFGEWYQWRTALLDALSAPNVPAATILAQMRQTQQGLTAIDAEMREDVGPLTSSAKQDTVQLSAALIAEVERFNDVNAHAIDQLASGATLDNSALKSPDAATKLRAALEHFNDFASCNAAP